jgi:hypothetical protein
MNRPRRKSEDFYQWVQYLRQDPKKVVTNEDLARVLIMIEKKLEQNYLMTRNNF